MAHHLSYGFSLLYLWQAIQLALVAYDVQIQYALDTRNYEEGLKLVTELENAVGSDVPEHMLLRSRFKRAQIYRRQNRYNEALTQLKRLRDIAVRHKQDPAPYEREYLPCRTPAAYVT